jgi:hypothetical protein
MAHRFCERRVFLEELDNTVGQLRVVATEALHLMEGNQYAKEEQLMLFFQW